MTPDQHPTPADGQPMTRRRLREIERARAAEAERARRAAAVSAPTPAASPEPPEWAEPPVPARDLPRRGPVASPPERRARSRASAPSEPPTITGAQRAVGATLGRKRPRGAVAVILTALVVVAIIAGAFVWWRSRSSWWDASEVGHEPPAASPSGWTPISLTAGAGDADTPQHAGSPGVGQSAAGHPISRHRHGRRGERLRDIHADRDSGQENKPTDPGRK